MMWKFIALVLLCASVARADLYTDAPGDIDPLISTGNGTVDILSLEVANTLTDITFTLSLNGNIATTDWGNFMIGISAPGGTGTTTGNAWNRPINMTSPNGGMDFWIGSWVNGGGGSQLWTYSGSWSGPSALNSFSFVGGSTSVITYVASLSSLGLTVGETIYFDAYSTGGGGTDSAVDALSNSGVSITSWNQTYNSTAPNISSYTVVPEPTTLVMFGLGIGAFTRFFRRRKQ